ncbi:MAG: DNA gyrase C-terminal beta-propeller domain-containing protein [Verrucomicrobiota bacterium]
MVDQLRDQGRNTRGVRGIRLKSDDDAVVGIVVVNPDETLMVITVNGYGKRTAYEEYRIQSRGGSGIITMRTSERNGKVVSAHSVSGDDAIMLISEGGQMIRMGLEDVRTISRNTQGVRLFNLGDNDRLVSCTPVEREDDIEEEESATAEEGEPAETPAAETEGAEEAAAETEPTEPSDD